MINWLDDPSKTLLLVAQIAAFGALISSLEGLALWRNGAYRQTGIWPWKILRTVGRKSIFHLVPETAEQQIILLITVLRGVAAISLILSAVVSINPLFPLAVLIVTHLSLSRRSLWGGEGGDQMMILVFLTTLLAATFEFDPMIAMTCTYFIAGQITLAYVASGTAKCFGPLWREGLALSKIMNHYTYGREIIADLLNSHPRLARLICHLVIGFQLTFPLFFLLPMPFALFYLVGGIFFHLGISLVMRLNLFLPVFLGTYPALIFAHHMVWNWR